MDNNLKKAFFNADIIADINSVRSGLFDTQGRSILFSGTGNFIRAEKAERLSGKISIGATLGGEKLTSFNRYVQMGEQKADKVWGEASRKYVNSIQGEVKTFVVGAVEGRVFRRIELPTLLKNEKVTKINGIDRKGLQELYQKKRAEAQTKGATAKQAKQLAGNEVYRAVAIAEVRQDLKQARQTKDEALRKDANKRRQIIQKQWQQERKVKTFVPRQKLLEKQQNVKTVKGNKQQARQDIKAKIDVLRDRKLKAEQSKDRSQRIDARKANTTDVQKLRAEHHAKIRAQKQARTQTQSKQQTVQKSVTPSTQTRKNARVHAFVKPSERSTAEKVRNPSEAKAELKQAMADKKVTHINGINKSRLNKSLETYKAQAVKQGATKENAAKIANNRLYHLMARHGQIRDRAKAFKDATQKRTLAHSSRTVSLQDSIISDRKSAAQMLGKQYKGVEAKSGHLRTATIKYGSERIRVMGQFAKNVKNGHVKPNEVASVKKRAQSALTRYAQTQFKGQRTHNQSKSETAKVNAPKTATQGHAKGMRMGHGRSR